MPSLSFKGYIFAIFLSDAELQCHHYFLINVTINYRNILPFCRLILLTHVLFREWIFLHFCCHRVGLVIVKD